jgi:hypothetical protein
VEVGQIIGEGEKPGIARLGGSGRHHGSSSSQAGGAEHRPAGGWRAHGRASMDKQPAAGRVIALMVHAVAMVKAMMRKVMVLIASPPHR